LIRRRPSFLHWARLSGHSRRLPGIRVVPSDHNWLIHRDRERGEILFCNMGPVEIREVIARGDDRPLPNEVVVDGLTVTGGGTYDLLNALVQSNGDLRVIVDEKTRVARKR
jgi:hypothetical protein